MCVCISVKVLTIESFTGANPSPRGSYPPMFLHFPKSHLFFIWDIDTDTFLGVIVMFMFVIKILPILKTINSAFYERSRKNFLI